MEPDTAAFAAGEPLKAKPGEQWAYTDGNYALLSRMIKAKAGGTPSDFIRFSRNRLFGPLGMRSMVVEFDAAGNPMGATHMIATARDWARFGWLFTRDGMIDSNRILPQGWVAYSSTPTVAAALGYGAGFWTNRGDSEGARFRRAAGAPADSFFASGNFGQIILVSPANDLVVVRLGLSNDPTGRESFVSTSHLTSLVIGRFAHGL